MGDVTTAHIDLAPGLDLDLGYVTKTAAILAQRRKGKTYTASVIAEELVRLGMPWVVLDPTGAWWGLRAGADGDPGGGLPVTILGGAHGDAPLERTSGRHVAELVIDTPSWYVLDLSLMETRAAEREFSYEFADALYRRKGQPGRDFPLHLFVDEADMFVPQERERDDNRMLGAFQSIVRRGGLRGLGTTLISQRPALVNKSVLVQLDILILLRLVAGNDQDYLEKNYVKRAGTPEQVAALMGSLASLRLGEAWIWEPGGDPALFERVQVRERYTFNSSATPKPGEQKIEPRGLAEVDLEALKSAMEETIERAKAEDPKELRKRIRLLEAEIGKRPTEQIEVEVVREVEVIPADHLAAIARMDSALSDLHESFGALRSVPTPELLPAPGPIARPALVPMPVAPRRVTTGPGSDTKFGAREKRILTVLAQYPNGRSEHQIAILTGYSPKASTIGAGLSALRQAGYVNYGQPPTITDEGRAALGEVEPLPTGEALIAYWMSKLGARERAFLVVLLERDGAPISQTEMAAATGYSPDSSTVGAGMSRLRALGMAQGWALHPEFARAVGR